MELERAFDPVSSRLALFSPVLGRHRAAENPRAPLFLQPFEDQVPGTVDLPVRLAFSLLHAAAGTVQQPLGAGGDRANAGRLVEDALAAEGTLLLVLAETPDVAEKQRVEPTDDPLVGAAGNRLDAGATGKDQQRFGLLDLALVLAQVAGGAHDVARLVDDHAAGYLLADRTEPLLHFEDFVLAARRAGGGTGGTPHQKEAGLAVQHLKEFFLAFLFADDHREDRDS
jgi:hypothetical protein